MRRFGVANLWTVSAVVAIALFAGRAASSAADQPADDHSITLSSLEGWHAVFGDTRFDWHERVQSEQPLNAVLAWSCRLGSRTIAQGEAPVRTAAGGSEVKIPLSIPPIKDGVVLAAEFSLTLTAAVGRETLAKTTEPLWVFSTKPFLDQDKWLAALSTRLFDPTQSTASVLTAAGVPHKVLTSSAIIDELSEGVLIVGEGVSLANERDLPEILLKAAGRGVSILVLAPGDGEAELPAELDRLRASGWTIALRGSEIIRQLDKRLDATAWPGAAPGVSAGLGLRADQDRLLLKISDHSAGWPWIELESPAHNILSPVAGEGELASAAAAREIHGRLIVCGFGIIKHWNSGPTPRYLFARSLQRLAGDGVAPVPQVEVEEK